MQNPFDDHKKNKVVGNIGHPIFPSFLSLMHNSAFKILDLNYIYVTFDVHPHFVESAIRGIVALGIAGVNVHYPHSESVIYYLDEVNGEASTLGQVNTIVNDGERLIGYNTNISGIIETLKPFKDEIFDQQCVIFGAGNIAKVAVYTLIKYFKPKNVIIINRDSQKAEKLRKYVRDDLNYSEIKFLPLELDEILPKNLKSKIIINATTLGMAPKQEECIIEAEKLFNENQIVVDFVFNPKETKFLQNAQKKKARTISGLEILLNQAAKTFELWTNKNMPLEKIRKILNEVHKD
jgi:shikimate dehydrogenase